MIGLLDEDQQGPGVYPQLAKDLQLILDNEKETTRAPADGPSDGETWEQYCERKTLTGMVNAAKSEGKDNMDHVEVP